MSSRSVCPRAVGFVMLVVCISSSGCDRGGEFAKNLDLKAGSIENELRLGSLDEAPYVFTNVKALEVGPDGSLYSLHPQEALVRRWSPEGVALGTIGRRGEGPGEFIAPAAMGWSGDSLWVIDGNRNSRVSYFDIPGNFLGTLSPTVDIGSIEQASIGTFPAQPIGLLGDGTIHGSTPAYARELADGRLTKIAHVRMRLDGSTLDTMTSFPVGLESVLSIQHGDARVYAPQPFGDGVLTKVTWDGRALLILDRPASRTGGRSVFRLHRVRLNGDTVVSRSIPYLPVKLSPDTLDSYVTAFAAGLSRQHRGTTLSYWANLVRDAVYVPRFYPPVSALVAGRDGTIWLARTPGTETGMEWLVLDRDGEALGTVEVPRALTLMMAERSTIWGTERDEFDVDYIVRYAVKFADVR
jgi:hypothetical protein